VSQKNNEWVLGDEVEITAEESFLSFFLSFDCILFFPLPFFSPFLSYSFFFLLLPFPCLVFVFLLRVEMRRRGRGVAAPTGHF